MKLMSARDLRGPVEVQDVKPRPDVDVVPRRKRERGGISPCPDDRVVLLPLPLRDRRIRDVGKGTQHLLHPALDAGQAGLPLLDRRGDPLHPLHQGGGVLFFPPQAADLLGSLVPLRPELFHGSKGLPPHPVEFLEPGKSGRGPAAAQRIPDEVHVLPHELQVEHRCSSRLLG
jgi:hypothetical protein